MRRGATLLVAAAALLIPASASAIQIHQHKTVPQVIGHDPSGPITATKVVTIPVDVAPADSDQDGIADTDDNCPNTASTVNGGCPAPPPAAPPADTGSIAATAPDTSTVAPAPATTSTGGCPSYMAGEASSPSAVNPSSGASGCYQVLPSTAAAMGAACSDVNSSSCVAAICASSGNAAWASSGSTPCDYIRP